MGFGGRRRPKAREPEIEEVAGPLWYGVWVLGLAGVALSVTAMCLPDWRVSPGLEYRYLFRSQEKNQSYMETKWGLYNISFDGGRAMVSWPQRVTTSTEAVTNAVRLGQQQTTNAQYQSWAAQCPAACQDALTTRLACYRRISYVNTLFLGILALGGALTLIGIGWFFLFGKMAYLMIGCWFVAGLICFGIAGYWIWETDTCWQMIILSQQFPLPKVSTSFYLMIIGASLYVLTAVLGLGAELLDRAKERQLKEMQKQQALMEGMGGPDAFSPGMQGPPGMVPGMMPGMAPGMMGPGGAPGMMGRPPGMMGGPPGMMGGPPGMMGGPPGMMGPQMGPQGMGGPMGRPSMVGGPMGAPLGAAGMAAGMGRGLPMGRPSVMGGPPPPGMGPPGMMGMQPKAPMNMRPPM